MDIRGKIALVTGANRGLGRVFAEALLEAGAAKVYAGARDPSAAIDPRVTPIHVDVTSSRDIATATTCTDIATRQDLIKKQTDMQALWDQHVAATRVRV